MTMPKGIVARATINIDTGKVVYIEIKRKPSFYSFYTMYNVDGKKKGKPLIASLAQGKADNLEDAVRKITARWWAGNGKVTSTKVVVFRKKEYRRLLHTDPSELGLVHIEAVNIPFSPAPKGQYPIGYTSLQKRMDILNPRR
jgi:hypothetical protein